MTWTGQGRTRFDDSPVLILWELTRACGLACRHCRATAKRMRHPDELTTEESFALLESIAEFGSPIVVLTGGDPALRPDLTRLIERGARLGLQMALTPSATDAATPELLRECRDAGLRRVALSLDAPTEEAHDAFRGVPGSYAKTLELLEAARELGLSTQVNTTVTRASACTFEEMAEAVLELPIDLWSVFFLVPTGRASAAQMPTAKQVERVFEVMADAAERAPFPIKATEAPHYRRYLLHRDPEAFGRSPNRLGLRDGHGVVFVSHTGEVYPSGFMPMRVGNVRETRLPDIYRRSPELRALRRPELFGGKCGWCEHRELCGGSRARAYALTGDPLGPEPTCVYVPARPEERAYFAAGI